MQIMAQILGWVETGWTVFLFQAALIAFNTGFQIIMDNKFNKNRIIAELECRDGSMCTIDKVICENGAWYCENGPWQCTNTDVICSAGFSCDPYDGICKSDDQLIPCVAVIDEDSEFGTPNQASRWEEFRTLYHSRPFCLLVPNPEGKVNIPPNFLADTRSIVYFNIIRDFGDHTLADDWAGKCGFAYYHPAQVGYVELFVDDSGSMKKSEVNASYNKFINFMATKNIEVKEVVNTNENWISPFLTTLV